MKRDRERLRRSVTPAVAMLALAVPPAEVRAQDQALPEVTVREAPSVAERNQLPATSESVTAERLADTVNMVNVEDGLKYFPSLIVRKRNYGDQQAPLATRTSGLGQSARSLIYADGILLSALIGNNNTSASPRWSMVTPEEVERIEVLYGPFSAAYPGNSMGAVVDITTRMPQTFEASAMVQGASQDFSLYGTKDTYQSWQAGALLGGKAGDLSWRLNANHLDAQTQPLNVVTLLQPATPSGAGTPVTGAYSDRNRLGQPIAVIGVGGLESKQIDNGKLRLAYDFTPQWQAAYTIGLFQNDVHSDVQTYLRNAAGQPVYSGNVNINGYNYNIGASSFSSSSGFYRWDQFHVAQGLSLKSDLRGDWDWEMSTSLYSYDRDELRIPGTALPGAQGGGAGSLQSLNGTGWGTADLKGFWRPQGPQGAHQASFGAHLDQYRLANTTYATADWINAGPGAMTADSRGRTRTSALWAQDVWRFAEPFRLTLGGRQEWWRAFDGRNFSAAPASDVSQPGLSASKFSPKASLAWEVGRDLQATLSYGTAYRFPTVSELYQAVTVSGVVFTPNPNLRPEKARSTELALERITAGGRVRASFFYEGLTDALISQNSTIPGTNVIGSSVQNIDRIRSFGLELAAQASDVGVKGLDLAGSFTWVDSEIVSDPNFRDASGKLVDVSGKYTPNIPRYKASGIATYRYDEHWSGSLGARYSDRVWSTIDNTDVYTHTYQGFDSYFVVDARLSYRFDRNLRASVGIDNLNNRQYYLFHPFPQRTVVAELRWNL